MSSANISSSVSWLDFAEEDRRTMMEVVSLFKLRETRDELGVGSIRNAFSDLLFPGTSTLQTRARYFLFVPWLYRWYEEQRLPSDKIRERLRAHEVRIIRSLREARDTDGLIGRISGASLNRFPSSIYWYGLQRWGIFKHDMSQHQYRRSLDSFYLLQKQDLTTDDGEPIERGLETNWDAHLPARPKGFPWEADFQLTYKEAEYLQEKLRLNCARSLLPYLVEADSPYEDEIEFAWFAPLPIELPKELAVGLLHARNFSELMYGAALLYNLMLAELDSAEDLIREYREEIAAWKSMLGTRKSEFLMWDSVAFWAHLATISRIPLLTQRFVKGWMKCVFDRDEFANVVDDKKARTLVRKREQFLKGGRSRFVSKRHRELWSGASGAFQMDYRWWVSRRIVNDIIVGLGAK